MEKVKHLYSGKAKSLFTTNDTDFLIMLFRDDISAFNGEKLEQLSNKGKINNYFNAYIMDYLKAHGINCHFEKRLNDQESLVKKLQMIPVECVVRNVVAGSLAKKLGIPEGKILSKPLFEFFYKSDKLGDPLINDDHILTFGWATEAEIIAMKKISLEVNELLTKLFSKANLLLVDFKLEFGRAGNQLYVGDEFSPDGCRIWDSQSLEKLDKDRFRRGLGDVIESYELVANRLGISLS